MGPSDPTGCERGTLGPVGAPGAGGHVLRLSPAEQARHTHVPEQDRERCRLLPTRWWLPQTAATTLGRWIVIRRELVDDRPLVAHELVHVRQWREQGIVGFLRRYLADYIRGRRAGLDHDAAYRAIPFEIEARNLSGH